MMEVGTVLGNGQERIAVFQAPYNDIFHSIHTEIMRIMLQHHGHTLLLNTLDHIVGNRHALQRTAGIVAVHIPVEIMEAAVLDSLRKS